jgi:hypothetical protein
LFKRLVVIAVLAAGLPAAAQDMNDLMAGKLVDPKVGQWAWYDITDAAKKSKFSVRQAIVGEEKVSGKDGYWVEMEIVPAIGYRTIYKMLLTGPASDPKNIHKIIVRQEPDPPETLTPDDSAGDAKSAPEPQRERVGKESVNTANGPVEAEHFRVTGDTGKMDLWVNEKVPPTGIVRMVSPGGEMVLRAYGVGGESAASVIDAKSDLHKPQVTVKAGKKEKSSRKEPAPAQGKGEKP